MALLQNNVYLKISSISVDYLHSRADVLICTYPTEQDRLIEKEKISEQSKFIFAAYSTIMNMQSQLIEKQQECGLPEKNQEEVFSAHPELKKLIDDYYSIKKEYDYLKTYLGKSNIIKENLKFKSIWESLGLTDKLCEQPPSFSYMSMSTDIPGSTDLSELYPAIKKYLPNSIDC